MQLRTRRGDPPKIYPTSEVNPGARIGLDAVIGAFCYVAGGAVIGAGCRLQGHTSLWDGVELGEDVFVGPGAMFTNVRHPRAEISRGPSWERTFVARGASIGARATLVAPITVGSYAMIAAGAVVVRDVPSHALVMGVPGDVRGWACTCGETLTLGGDPPAQASCRTCNRRFVGDGGGLREASP